MKRNALLNAAESLMARLAFLTVPRLSRAAVVRTAHRLGAIAYHGSRHLRRVGEVNLDLAFGDTMSPTEKRQVLKASFQNFALVLLDSFWFARDAERRIAEWVTFDPGVDVILQPAAQICVTAHLGNWEVLGQAVTLRGYPLTSVAAPLANPDVDALFMATRRRTGQQVYSKRGVLRVLLRTLRTNGKVALVMDQNTKLNEGGLFVNFFGLPVPVSSAPAMLSLKTGAPIFVGACLPDATGRYRVETPQPVENISGDVATITQQITDAIARLVRATPHLWLWTYKRWKYVAPGLPRDRYPFYAKEVRRAKPVNESIDAPP